MEVARIAWLTSLTQPYSELEDLKLAVDWHTWLFAHDDMVDATAVGRDPEKVTIIHNRLIEILQGDEPSNSDNEVANALANIRGRVEARTIQVWASHFIDSVKQYFQGNNWEVANLAVQFCDWEMEAFIKLERRLPAFDPVEQPLVEAFLTAMKAWMAGHIQWYRETGRYLERPT